jgi:hypothetical protein
MNKLHPLIETAERLTADNPWLDIALEIEDAGYENPTSAIHRDDREIVEKYNAHPSTKEEHKLVINLPPEPFWGNPLTAEVAILMLNPGYLEPYNVDMYDVLDKASQKEFIKAKCDTMSMRDGWCVPTKEVMNKKLATIMNLIGGNYWIGKSDSKLGYLLSKYPEANKKIAIVQLLGYHSKRHGTIPKQLLGGKPRLPTQDYAIRLVRYMMQQGKVLIISSVKWFDHVDGLESYEGKVMMKHHLTTIIAPEYLEDGGWEKIKAALSNENLPGVSEKGTSGASL